MTNEKNHFDWISLGSDDACQELPHGMQRYDGGLNISCSPKLARYGYTLLVRKEDCALVDEFNSQLQFLKGNGLFVETPAYHADDVLEFQLLADEDFFHTFNRQFNVMNLSFVPNVIGEIFKRLFLARSTQQAEEKENLYKVTA